MLDVPRTTNTVFMVRPYDFGFNEETIVDNEFQHQPLESEIEKKIRRPKNSLILMFFVVSPRYLT
ncbi:MAG: hypothetical protein HQK63_09930 [Desulfamplus sp.]|nr:hypothetical protein [Desulfamplus sp.]